MNILTLSVRSFLVTHMFKIHPGVFGFLQALTRTLSFDRKYLHVNCCSESQRMGISIQMCSRPQGALWPARASLKECSKEEFDVNIQLQEKVCDWAVLSLVKTSCNVPLPQCTLGQAGMQVRIQNYGNFRIIFPILVWVRVGGFNINVSIKCRLELNGNRLGIIKLTNSLCYQNLLFMHLLLGLIKLVEGRTE